MSMHLFLACVLRSFARLMRQLATVASKRALALEQAAFQRTLQASQPKASTYHAAYIAPPSMWDTAELRQRRAA